MGDSFPKGEQNFYAEMTKNYLQCSLYALSVFFEINAFPVVLTLMSQKSLRNNEKMHECNFLTFATRL